MKRWQAWGALAALAAGLGLFYALGGTEVVSFANLQAQREVLQGWARDAPVLASVGFMVGYAVVVACSIPAGALMTLAAGYMFGFWWGTAVVVVGATAGATAVFGIAQSAVGETLRARAGGWYAKMAHGFEQNALAYMLFLRLVPVFPFAMVNVVPALFKVRWRDYVLTTFFGIMPGTMVLVNVGRTLGELTSVRGLLSSDMLLALTALACVALVPVGWQRWQARRKG